MRDKVLVIDDDEALGKVVSLALEGAGYWVEVAQHGLEGLQKLYQWRPDLVILDVMMPRMDGWETCRRIREISNVPILMLTAKVGDANELKGLREGADVYMTKPFAVSVLVGRVEALLRRSRLGAEKAAKPAVVNCGDLRVDIARHEATLNGKTLDLTPTEFRLLAALAAKAGEVVSHRELLTQVWGPEYAGEDMYLKLYVRYLRQKIEKDPAHPVYIVTRRGVGYFLNDGTPAADPETATAVEAQ